MWVQGSSWTDRIHTKKRSTKIRDNGWDVYKITITPMQAIDILDEMINGCDFLIEQYIEDWDWDVTYPQNVRHYLRQAKSRIQGLDVPSNDGWIPVTERMPCDDEEYIICTSDWLVTSVAWSTDENNWIVWITNWRTDIFWKITHWMPLPTPPNK